MQQSHGPFAMVKLLVQDGFDLTMLDHPRSVIFGLRLVLKFGLDPIYTSFGDRPIAIFIFRHFGLKLPTPAHLGGGELGFPQIWSPIVLTPKRHLLVWKRCLSHKA